ncbi:MAG TPA: hypothetical protein VEA69_21380 [Tepidisphaeraceae bacterium]|nr:hypothetical protein [Tepidisphaeraceae bacterium]
MVRAIREIVTVGEDGSVSVKSPELRAGARAEVIVLVEGGVAPSAAERLAALEALQRSLSLTPEQTQKWLDESAAERKAWGP